MPKIKANKKVGTNGKHPYPKNRKPGAGLHNRVKAKEAQEALKSMMLTCLGKPRKTFGGRPTLLTQEFQDELVNLLNEGCLLMHACDILQVSYQNVYDWMVRGENDIKAGLEHGPYAKFFRVIKAARSNAVLGSVKVVRAGLPGWQGSAWYLERAHYKQFGQIQRVEMSGPDGLPIQTETKTDLSRLSIDEMRQMRDLIQKASATDVTVEVVK